MDQNTVYISPSGRGFKVIVSICLVALTAAVVWLIYRVENLPAEQTKQETSTTQNQTDDTADTANGDIWSNTITSGKSAFQISVPDGWGPLVNPNDADTLRIAGTAQPTVAAGSKVDVSTPASLGDDNPSVFFMTLVSKGGFEEPKGTASDFTFGKAEDAVTGKKYVYEYARDEVVGVSTQRFAGDRDYHYVFPVGDKELHVAYSVYGSDPRNQSQLVDEIVRTIKLK